MCEEDLAPFPAHTLPAVHSRLAPSLLTNPEWSTLIDSLHKEIMAVGATVCVTAVLLTNCTTY